jgi:hypothetical protein
MDLAEAVTTPRVAKARSGARTPSLVRLPLNAQLTRGGGTAAVVSVSDLNHPVDIGVEVEL